MKLRKITSSDIQSDDYGSILSVVHLAEQSFDEGNFDVHQSLLTGNFDFKSPFGSYSQINDYMSWLRSFYDTVQAQGGTRHVVTNAIVNINGANATMIAYLTIFNKKTMGLMGTSVINDTLVKGSNGWKLSAREIYSDQF